jgi:hypothetical protein
MNYYVIYKGSGGLIHMLGGLVFAINYCIKYNNILIIDVISHNCYKHYLSDFFNIINSEPLIYSEDYNLIEPKNIIYCKKYTINDIKNYPDIEVPTMSNGTLYHIYKFHQFELRYTLKPESRRQLIKIYAGPGLNDYASILKFIKVKPEIVNIIKEKPMIENYLGVHFRNTDIKNNINNVINLIKKYKYNNIYLATDDATAYDKIKISLPNYNIYQYTKPINANGEPIHYAEKNKYNLILNILIDIYFLYHANDFIPSAQSTVSRFVSKMRNKKIDIFI